MLATGPRAQISMTRCTATERRPSEMLSFRRFRTDRFLAYLIGCSAISTCFHPLHCDLIQFLDRFSFIEFLSICIALLSRLPQIILSAHASPSSSHSIHKNFLSSLVPTVSFTTLLSCVFLTEIVYNVREGLRVPSPKQYIFLLPHDPSAVDNPQISM
jgi:hypothetical protein